MKLSLPVPLHLKFFRTSKTALNNEYLSEKLVRTLVDQFWMELLLPQNEVFCAITNML